jgi:hypothetical protein
MAFGMGGGRFLGSRGRGLRVLLGPQGGGGQDQQEGGARREQEGSKKFHHVTPA